MFSLLGTHINRNILDHREKTELDPRIDQPIS